MILENPVPEKQPILHRTYYLEQGFRDFEENQTFEYCQT